MIILDFYIFLIAFIHYETVKVNPEGLITGVCLSIQGTLDIILALQMVPRNVDLLGGGSAIESQWQGADSDKHFLHQNPWVSLLPPDSL